MMTNRAVKRKDLASSVSPEANRSKKHQGGDICGICNAVVKDKDECSIQCQWCQVWEHSECAKISIDECTILAEALEYYDDKEANHPLTIDLLEKQSQLTNKLAVVKAKLYEMKEELTVQLSKCHEIISTPEVNPTKTPAGPALIANTIFTGINEERDREKR